MLNKHAPLKKKLLRANHAPYITKALRKAIIRRSQLETKYLKTKTQTNLYKKDENFCSKLYKRESTKFWKTMGPFLSDKNTVFSQISIEKKNRTISDDFDLSEEFNTFFEDAVRLLNVEPDEY